MFEILQDALNNIESLELFYYSLIDDIKKKEEEGIKKNYMGGITYRYFALLGLNDSKTIASFPKEVVEIIESCYKDVEIVPSNNGERFKVTYRLENDNFLKKHGFEDDPQKANIQLQHFREMQILHANNTLMMLITRFEEFIGKLLYYLFKCYPDKYINNQKLSLFEIEGLSHDELVDIVTQRQVEEKMWEDYKAWKKTFEEHKFDFSKCREEWNDFTEMYYRRNIIVHNSGRVNGIYIKSVPDSKNSVGDYLHATPGYLKKAFRTTRILIYTIMIEAARLLAKEQRDDYYTNICNSLFDFLEMGDYDICEKIYPQIASKNEVDFEVKIVCRINKWIALKESGRFDDAKHEIESFDVSALHGKYKCAKMILLNQYESAVQLLESLFPKEFTPYELETWPLFKSFRNTEEYHRFHEVHSDEFPSAEMDVEDNKKDDDLYKNIPATEVIP